MGGKLVNPKSEKDRARVVAACGSTWRRAHGQKSEDGIKSKSVGEDDFDYIIPTTIDELEEGHIVKYKDKIGKIVKVIGD